MLAPHRKGLLMPSASIMLRTERSSSLAAAMCGSSGSTSSTTALAPAPQWSTTRLAAVRPAEGGVLVLQERVSTGSKVQADSAAGGLLHASAGGSDSSQ